MEARDTEFGARRLGDGRGPQGDKPKSREPRVQSVAKATKILFAVAQSSNGLRAVDVSEKLDLPRQATYHLVHTLVTLGLLTRGPDQRYLLGLKIGILAEAFPRHLAPPERLSPYLRAIAYATGETCYASGWWEGEITNLAVVRGRNATQAAEVPHGLTTDAHARASGKLLLAMADDPIRERYLTSHPLRPRTQNTITDMDTLLHEFQRIRTNGYAIDNEEYQDGLCCIAMPIDDGTMPYTVGLSAPAEQFTQSLEFYLKSMRQALQTSS
nr:IclR family transcriptional regulator [Mesorhizobium sp.]